MFGSPSIVGSYSSTKWLWISWIVKHDFPTPPPPTTTSLYSRRNCSEEHGQPLGTFLSLVRSGTEAQERGRDGGRCEKGRFVESVGAVFQDGAYLGSHSGNLEENLPERKGQEKIKGSLDKTWCKKGPERKCKTRRVLRRVGRKLIRGGRRGSECRREENGEPLLS